ncbi:MAG: alpha/beta hydrolase [Acidobacteria bacterium]|nr:alpha/beta hydrolase [Acidobacteriota bacterium]
MRPPSTLLLLPLAVALVGCTVQAPESEEPVMPAGPENGSFTANLNDFQIHYEVHGQGPVLMALTNSWGLSLEGLRAMYRPLEERLTMVYFDPRGMGGSEAAREDADRGLAAVRADFQALREHLGLETVNAIGWSNGAVNLIWLAHERPETLSSAIFLHGMAAFTEEDAGAMQETHPELMATYQAFMKEIADPGLSVGEQTALQRKMWLEDYFPTLFADPEAASSHLARIFADAELSWPHAAYANEEAPTFDARDLLPEIPVRSLVMAGRHDMIPPEGVKPLHDGLPNSQWLVFENSGHFAPVEEPALFADAVFDFLGVGSAAAVSD